MKKILMNISSSLFTLFLSFVFIQNVYADCTGARYGSNECRVTNNRTIWVAGNAANSYPYRNLYDSTYTYRQNVDVDPTDRYTIGITFSAMGVSCSPYCSETVSPVNRDNYSVLYCMDPAANGAADLYAERFLGTINNNFYKTMDYGLLYVLTGGGSGPVPANGLNNSTGADSWARLNAIRMVLYTFRSGSTAVSASFAMTLMNKWLAQDSKAYDNLNAYFNNKLLEKSYYNKYANGIVLSGAPVDLIKKYYYGALEAMLDYAQNLATNAKVEADPTSPVPSEITSTIVGENLIDAPSSEIGGGNTNTGNGQSNVTGNASSVFVQEDVVHTVKVTGMPNNGDNKFVIDDIVLDKTVDGLTYYIKSIQIGDQVIDDRSAIQNMLGQNLLSDAFGYDFTNETTILITVHFEGYESSDDPNITVLKCGQAPIKYHIGGSYATSDPGLFEKYTGVIWYNDNAVEKQRYIGVEVGGGGDSGDEWTSPYTTYLVDECSCDELIEACTETGNINSEECQNLFQADCGDCAELEVRCDLGDQNACTEYGAVCDVDCLTTVDEFECCDANNLIVSTADDHKVNILGPDDEVRVCFVSQIDAQVERNGSNGAIGIAGAVDDVDNSYSLFDIKDQNKYCHVSCKEDYMMTMPTAKLVNAGRYFTFKASVDGTKTCYTNTIDRELYNEDMLAAQVELVNAYNNFKDWEAADKAAKENINSTYVNSSHPRTGACGCDSTTAPYISGARTASYTYDYFYITDSDNTDTGVIIGYMGTSSGQKSVSSVTHQVNGGRYSACSVYNEDGTCQTTCRGDCYYTVIDDEKDVGDLEQYIAGELSSARSRLANAQAAYESLIKQYNTCSEWDTEINYDPDIYYDYEESYLADMYNNRGKMDDTITSESSTEWYCNSNVSSNGSETQAMLTDATYESCSLATSSSVRYTSVNYIYCDESTCTPKGEEISDARYKKLSSNIKVNYVPSTLFYNEYPSGNIGKYDKNNGDTLPDDGVALDNKLPVSLSTKRGIYEYIINIGNLGEYYDKSQPENLGRLVDGEDSGNNPVINAQEYSDYVDPTTGYAHYMCAYLVNMGITDEDTIVCDWDNCTENCDANCIGPNCDNTCDGDDCIADCIGSGCIYDVDASSSLIERVVSLNNLFPNGTNSYNWNRDENTKAAATINEIQEAGNTVYDGDPILSVTITPSANQQIKAYNDSSESSGGYSNDTLDCYDIGGYEEIACYSSFINDLLNGTYGEVVNDRSLILGNNYRTIRDNNTEYFTLWNGTISETDMLGPSWK